MGTVWAATDQVLHRQVAIKEIDFPPGTPAAERAQLEARTLREARAIAALSNPYVITLFDILTLEHGPVIVMELLRARSLAEILRRVGRLPDGQAATIGVAVASGLIAAHAAGITHRDVKPGNVLICDDGRIKLTDFGIARSSAEQTMTATGLLLGSPAYIAPEVANGVPVGPISDAWSLGGLLFATVEGRPPFDQGTAIATLTSVVRDPVPPHPHSGRLGAVVSGLLVKTPSLRMRIDRALTIMRTVADDPSGMNLSAIARIPRDEDAAPARAPFTDATGRGIPSSGGTAGRSAAVSSGPKPSGTPRRDEGGNRGRPSVHQSGSRSNPPLHGTARPPVHGGVDSTGSSGAFAGPPPSPQPVKSVPPPRRDVDRAANTGQSGHSSTAAARGTEPPGQRPRSPGSPPRDNPDGAARDSRHMPLASIQQALPPPPWAPEQAAALPPLPDDDDGDGHGDAADDAKDARGTAHSTRVRIIAAVVVAIIAAVIGFFGVRLIADLASRSASQNGAAVTAVDGSAEASAISWSDLHRPDHHRSDRHHLSVGINAVVLPAPAG